MAPYFCSYLMDCGATAFPGERAQRQIGLRKYILSRNSSLSPQSWLKPEKSSTHPAESNSGSLPTFMAPQLTLRKSSGERRMRATSRATLPWPRISAVSQLRSGFSCREQKASMTSIPLDPRLPPKFPSAGPGQNTLPTYRAS